VDDPPSEIHIVNGLHPDLPFSYYEELLRGFKRIKPDVVMKCFTAVEIHFFRRALRDDVRRGADQASAAGLDSLPGAPEIFHPEVRTAHLGTTRRPPNQYLEVHDVAHRLGMKTKHHHAVRSHRRHSSTGSITCSGFASSKTRAAAFRHSSRSPFTPTATE